MTPGAWHTAGIQSHTHTHPAHKHTHAPTHTRPHTHAPTHTHAHTHIPLTHTHAHTHARTHTLAHNVSLLPTFCRGEAGPAWSDVPNGSGMQWGGANWGERVAWVHRHLLESATKANLQVIFLLSWLSIPSGFLVVFEKPNRSSFTFT